MLQRKLVKLQVGTNEGLIYTQITFSKSKASYLQDKITLPVAVHWSE